MADAPSLPPDFAAMPGGDLIAEGLSDLARGEQSVAALLVLIGAPRLRRLGVRVQPCPMESSEHESPEHTLYSMLHQLDADAAHSRYNALIRRLVSFERAAECAA